jgi:hypothetical protein
VTIENGTAVIGAPTDDHAGERSGSVYVFDVASGEQIRKIIADDATHSDEFGADVSMSDGTVLIGAPWDYDAAALGGSVYLFDVASGTQIQKMTENNPQVNHRFGSALAQEDEVAVAGVKLDDTLGENAGAVSVLRPIGDADLNGDGVINEEDLLLLLEVWGECPECPADIDGDGVVGVKDLLLLLSAWT